MTGWWQKPRVERGARFRDFIGEGGNDRNIRQGECRPGQVYGGAEGDRLTLAKHAMYDATMQFEGRFVRLSGFSSSVWCSLTPVHLSLSPGTDIK